jgi:tetratricopeptide (TPR) repeat protein
MMQEAQELVDAGRYAEAEALYRSVVEEEPGNTEALYMLGVVRQRQGDPAEAIRLMRSASGQDPENADIHYSLGTLQMSVKAVDEARQSYLRALQIDPFHVGAHNGVAYTELSAGNYKAAEKAANLALTEDPKNVQALVYMGSARLEQGEFTKAISYLQEALNEAPEHQAAQVQLGRAFLAAGNAGFAMQCFQNAVEAQPDSGLVWDYLGTAQFANKLVAEAAQSFQRALSLGRTDPAVYRGLAECQRALGFPEQAEQTLAQAGQADASGAQQALVRAELMIARGDPRNALEILQPLNGLDADVLKARAYEQMRAFDQALGVLEPHLEGGTVTDELSLAYARLLTKSGREEEATALVDELLAQDEPPVLARLHKGFHLCRRGDAEGIDMLQQVEQEPGLSEVDQRRARKMLATTLDRLGRYEEAAGYFAALSGRLAQAVVVAGGAARANREWLEAGQSPGIPRRPAGTEMPADPVFLLAWPGSGWEWLAAGLGAHPGVMLVMDKPATQIGRRALISQPAGAEALASWTPEAAGQAMRRYWDDLKAGGLEPAGRVTLDSMWLSADMLPTLASLFPASRVIVVGREPGDMVLEWFRAGYADLEDMARTWADQQQALEQYREKLELAFIDVDGARLLQDPAAELKPLCEALGLEWDSAMDQKLNELASMTAAAGGTWRDYRAVLSAPLALASAGSENSTNQEPAS